MTAKKKKKLSPEKQQKLAAAEARLPPISSQPTPRGGVRSLGKAQNQKRSTALLTFRRADWEAQRALAGAVPLAGAVHFVLQPRGSDRPLRCDRCGGLCSAKRIKISVYGCVVRWQLSSDLFVFHAVASAGAGKGWQLTPVQEAILALLLSATGAHLSLYKLFQCSGLSFHLMVQRLGDLLTNARDRFHFADLSSIPNLDGDKGVGRGRPAPEEVMMSDDEKNRQWAQRSAICCGCCAAFPRAPAPRPSWCGCGRRSAPVPAA